MSFVEPSNSVDIQLNSVLLANDFSPASAKALPHALAVARHYGAKVYLAHVVSALGLTLAGPDALSEAADLAMRDSRQLQQTLVANGALNGLRHEVIVREGDIPEELGKAIEREKVDVVVLGTHSRRGLEKLLLGSVAEQIFRQASCLVLTVGPSSPDSPPIEKPAGLGPMLFATDFSRTSLFALPYAISFANRHKTKLVLLNVIPEVPLSSTFGWHTPEDVARLQKADRETALQKLRDLVSTAHLLSRPEFVVESGEPTDVILRTAKKIGVDTIVLGLNRASSLGIGSHAPWGTAYAVVCGASCPVLTVRS